MPSNSKQYRPAPLILQAKRLRWKYGLSPTQARMVAALHYGEA